MLESLTHFRDTYVEAKDNSIFKIGEFKSEREARDFLSKLDLNNLHTLWYVMVNGLIRRTQSYFSTRKGRNLFLKEIEQLVNSIKMIENLNDTRKNNFVFQDSIVKEETRYFVLIKNVQKTNKKVS